MPQLRADSPSFAEAIGRSVANVSPTLTPAVAVAVVVVTAGTASRLVLPRSRKPELLSGIDHDHEGVTTGPKSARPRRDMPRRDGALAGVDDAVHFATARNGAEAGEGAPEGGGGGRRSAAEPILRRPREWHDFRSHRTL